MRFPIIAAALAIALPQTALAQDPELVREVKLSKGKAKVKFYGLPTDGAATGPRQTPTVGVAPSPNMGLGNYIAKSFDDTRKVVVVPPSRFGETSQFETGFDSMIRSDLEREISAACKSQKLNYLLLMSPPDASFKMDPSIFMFGLGRTRFRNVVEARLYDCPTSKIVWNQRLLLESSQGTMSATFEGTTMATGESERAFAQMIVEKISADTGW